MLSPTQVIPFLLNDASDVRYHAVHYLAGMGDLAPMETSDVAWSALHLHGRTLTDIGLPLANGLLRLIAGLVPTDLTARRTLDRLRETRDEDEIFWLNEVLQSQSLDFLAEHRAEWEAVALTDARQAIEARLALWKADAEPLWQTLVQLDEVAKTADSIKGISERAEPVIEALRRHRDHAIAYSMEVLNDPRERWWLEIWAAEIVCGLRHAPAIDALIEKMSDDEGDYLRIACERGLGRMEPELLVPKLQSAGEESDDPLYRNSIAVVLGRVKHPLAEAAIIRLLEKEDDPTTRGFLAMALCDLCTTDGLELLRKLVVEHNYDRSVADIMELLVTQCQFVGYAPPELPQWNKTLQKKAGDRRARQNLLMRSGFGNTPRDMVHRFASLIAGKDHDDDSIDSSPTLPARAHRSLEIPTPIRRSEPKVGRNDPCPCGTGKKFKKCCGKG